MLITSPFRALRRSTSDSQLVFTFQVSEAVTGFESGDVNITNGSAGIAWVRRRLHPENRLRDRTR
jgi:hypothetical protein